jgi:hypothetical protein
LGSLEITLIEVVSNVPSKRAKLLTFMYYSMEAAYTECEFFKFFWLFAIIEEFIFERAKTSKKICLDSFGWF